MVDFDHLPSRVGTDSYKYDVKEGTLPMWVADMDFPCPEEVSKALIERAKFPIFGYVSEDKRWRSSIVNYFKANHETKFKEEHLVFSTGVLATLSAVIRAFSSKGDKIGFFSPAYNCFYSVTEHLGRIPYTKALSKSDDGYAYSRADLEDLARNCSVLIICNPHNPVGEIWSEAQLEEIVRVCKKHNCFLFVDEIHGDITDPNEEYHSVMALTLDYPNLIMASSPTKTFNLAGIQTSFAVALDEAVRKALEAQLGTDDCGEPNSFSMVACIAAYTHGESYRKALREYLKGNKDYFYAELERRLPCLKAERSKATYLVWVDCSSFGDSLEVSAKLEEAGLKVSPGEIYGDSTHIRVNLATSRSNVEEAIKRMEKALLYYI